MTPPKIVRGDSVHVVFPGGERGDEMALVVSVHDSGLVLGRVGEGETDEIGKGLVIKLVATREGRAFQTQGVVAGSSSAGIAVHLKEGWRALERREFPRVRACIPMRFRRIEDHEVEQVEAAVRSRITSQTQARPTESSSDKSDLAAIQLRLMRIERTLELLTDFVLRPGPIQGALLERVVEVSASGIAFTPDRIEDFPPGTRVELEFLLPLADPVRVRATSVVVRHVSEQGKDAVAVQYDCIGEDDRDEIARYVFQLQRRRHSRV
jgi:hypothetical protein